VCLTPLSSKGTVSAPGRRVDAVRRPALTLLVAARGGEGTGTRHAVKKALLGKRPPVRRWFKESLAVKWSTQLAARFHEGKVET